jgi:hypothetical protein
MDRYYPASITVATGTAITNPHITILPLENAQLVDIEMRIPPGHGGLTGVRIEMSRQQVLPWGNNTWLVGDNYERTFDVNAEIGVNTIRVLTYNTDVFAHTFYLMFHIRNLPGTSDNTPSQIGGSLAGVIADGFTDESSLFPVDGTGANGDIPLPPLPPVPPPLLLPPPP